MPWARLDDGFHDHPKVDGLSLAAVGLYTLCLTWAHRHRRTAIVAGHITEARVQKLAGKAGAGLAAELVEARLWEVEPHVGGWVIHDFADYLPKERDPDERREAGRKGAAKRWETAKQTDGKPDGKLPGSEVANRMASDSSRGSAPAYPSRPDPTTELTPGGKRPETLRSVPATQPPEGEERCSRHPNGNPTDEPCNGCKRVEDRKRRREDKAAEKRQREADDRARNCPTCEGTHFVLDADKLPTRRKCDHRRRTA